MEAMINFSIASILTNVFSWAISIALYVLQALGLYTIAKRRGIQSAWLAWVPVGNYWLIGSIADHYRTVTRGEKKNRRMALLILGLSIIVLCIAFVILVVGIVLNYGLSDFEGPAYFGGSTYDLSYGVVSNYESTVLSVGLLFVLFWFLLLGIGIAFSVLYYICLYEIYESCDSSNKVLYLLLSIFLGLAPVFLFVCRNKDLGMYPRPKPVPMGYAPYPYQTPQYQPPQYQAPQYPPQYPPQYQAPQYPPQYMPQYQAPQYQPPQYPPQDPPRESSGDPAGQP